MAELKHKQEAQSQLLKQKQRREDAAKRLQDEIQRIKAQKVSLYPILFLFVAVTWILIFVLIVNHKVQLQNKIKQESEQFRAWKVLREKEVLQV